METSGARAVVPVLHAVWGGFSARTGCPYLGGQTVRPLRTGGVRRKPEKAGQGTTRTKRACLDSTTASKAEAGPRVWRARERASLADGSPAR